MPDRKISDLAADTAPVSTFESELNNLAGASVRSTLAQQLASSFAHGSFTGVLRRTAANAFECVRHNWTATVAPAVTDDSASGYAVGSTWIDVTADKEYACLDAASGAAVWASTGDVAGPSSVTDNAFARYDGTTGKLIQAGQTVEDDGGNLFVIGNIVVTGTVDGVDVASHASRHITGGTDEVDGDQLDVDWSPSTYTPATTPAEVTSVDHLTAHLYGIDQELTPKGEAAAISGTTASSSSTYENRVTRCTNAAGCTFTVNSGTAGAWIGLIATTASQQVTLAAGTATESALPDGKTAVSRSDGSPIFIYYLTATTYAVMGDLA